MHATFRLPHCAALLLLAAAPLAGAESPMPDPVAPAVIGRPLDQIRPAPPARKKAVAAKPKQAQPVAATAKAASPRPAAAVAKAPAQEARPPQQVAAQAPQRREAIAPTAVLGANGAPAMSHAIAPGRYFSSRDEALVREYYALHPVAGTAPKWKAGDPVPPKAALTGVPDDLRAALTAQPRGRQYVQVDGEVVLVAVQTRTVLDGVSRAPR